MAHWFHRNPLKATSVLLFDFGAQSATPLSRNICIDAKESRAFLLRVIPDPNQDVPTLTTALDKYIGFLLGFVNPVDPPTGQSQSPSSRASAPQSTAETNEDSSANDENTSSKPQNDLSSIDSKLRNALKITWTNSVGDKTVNQHDFVFELINCLFNYALWHTKHAAKVAASSVNIEENDAKEIYRCLRTAAGIFSYIQDKLIVRLFERPENATDLDTNVLTAYILQCTAEAQEVTVARAIELKHKPNLISALAHETYNLFRKASDSLRSVDETVVCKWRKYLLLKSAIYFSYAHSYNGQSLLDSDECGKAIRALREGVSLHHKAELLCSEYAASKGTGTAAKPELHPFFRKLGTTVKRILDKCERENGFIYHQKVPDDLPELESKAAYGLASPIEFELASRCSEWTWDVYNGFNISVPQSDKKRKDKEQPVQHVKEVPIENTDKEPNNTSGCSVS